MMDIRDAFLGLGCVLAGSAMAGTSVAKTTPHYVPYLNATVDLRTKSVDTDAQGKIRAGELAGDFAIDADFLKTTVLEGTRLEFFADGNIRTIDAVGTGAEGFVQNAWIPLENSSAGLYPDGHLRLFQTALQLSFDVANGKAVHCDGGSSIELYPGQALAGCAEAGLATLTINGKNALFAYRLDFYESGELKSGFLQHHGEFLVPGCASEKFVTLDSGPIELDPMGQLASSMGSANLDPAPSVIYQEKEYTGYYSDPRNCSVAISFRDTFAKPKLNGYRIMASANPEFGGAGAAEVKELCASQFGFDGSSRYPRWGDSSYVDGSETFFDLSTGRFETIEDDTVRLVFLECWKDGIRIPL